MPRALDRWRILRWTVGLIMLVALIVTAGWVWVVNPTVCREIYMLRAYTLQQGTPVSAYNEVVLAEVALGFELLPSLLCYFDADTEAPVDMQAYYPPANEYATRDDYPLAREWDFIIEEEEEPEEPFPHIDGWVEYDPNDLCLLSPPESFSGTWRTWYRSGQLASREVYENGKRTHLELYMPDGECIQRESYVNGVPQGEWIVTAADLSLDSMYLDWDPSKYSGQMENGKPHGAWTVTDGEDVAVKGIFNDGVRQGRWTWMWGHYRGSQWVDTPLTMTYRQGKVWSGLCSLGEQSFLARWIRRYDRYVYCWEVPEIRGGRPWNGMFGTVEYRDGRPFLGVGSHIINESGTRANVFYYGKEITRKRFCKLFDLSEEYFSPPAVGSSLPSEELSW